MLKLYKLDIFSPLHFSLMLVFFYIVFKYFLMYLGLSKYPLGYFESTDFVTLLIFIQFLFIFIFYIAFKNLRYDRYINIAKRQFAFDIHRTQHIRIINFLVLTATVGLYEIYYRAIGTSFFEFGEISPIKVKILAGVNPIAYIFVKGFADSLLMIWTFIIGYSVVMRKKYILSFIILLTVVICLALSNGSRGAFVFGAILPLLMIVNAFKKRLSASSLLLLFVTVTFILGVLGIIRAQTQGATITAIFNVVTDLDDKVSYVFLSILDRRLDSFYPNLMHVFDNIDQFEFRYGFDYINIILQYVPRSFYPDKPYTLVREANNILMLQDEGGTGFSSIFEAWMNFGPIGLVLNALLAALALNFFQRMYIYARDYHQIIMFVFSAKIGVSFVSRFFIAPGITHNSAEIVFSILLFLSAFWLIRLMAIPSHSLRLN